jgi:hypothetical protein
MILGGPDVVYVLKYGSDPLKTYLPDSDIDFTVIIKDHTEGKPQSESPL